AMNDSAQPGEILLPGGAVEAENSLVFIEVLLAEARIELERARLAGREAQDREGDDRGEKDQDDAEDQAADDVLGHCRAESRTKISSSLCQAAKRVGWEEGKKLPNLLRTATTRSCMAV